MAEERRCLHCSSDPRYSVAMYQLISLTFSEGVPSSPPQSLRRNLGPALTSVNSETLSSIPVVIPVGPYTGYIKDLLVQAWPCWLFHFLGNEKSSWFLRKSRMANKVLPESQDTPSSTTGEHVWSILEGPAGIFYLLFPLLLWMGKRYFLFKDNSLSVDACEAPPPFKTMKIKGGSKHSYGPGDRIDYECRSEYKRIPSLPMHTVCNNDGTWTALKEACTCK